MSYTITTTILPSGSSFYVTADASNPSSIDTTATLRFYADGTYYIMNSTQSSAVAVTGADIVSWTRVSTKEAVLVINNPTQNVTVTVTAKQAITPLEYNKPFNITAKAAIDIRLVLTKEQMLTISDAKMPDYYFCICKDDHEVYIYDKTNSKDTVLGKFRPLDNYLTVTNNMSIDGGEVQAHYALTANYTNVTPDITPAQVDYNQDLTITFTPSDGYTLPSTVTVNGEIVGANIIDLTTFKTKWIQTDGKLYLLGTTGDVEYTIVGIKGA